MGANALLDEVVVLAEEKNAFLWKAFGMLLQGRLSGQTGKSSDAVRMITSGIAALRSTGSTYVDALACIIFGESICGTRPIR